MISVVVASSNKNKISEIKSILDFCDVVEYTKIVGKSVDIPEDGRTFEENALIKADSIYKMIGGECLVLSDDSGLCVDELDGEPGIYSARYANGGDNNQKLIGELKRLGINSSSASFVSAIALVGMFGGKNIRWVERGEVFGRVIDELRGKEAFGYDPLFLPDGFSETFAQMGEYQKNKISHRAIALQKTKDFLVQIHQKSSF